MRQFENNSRSLRIFFLLKYICYARKSCTAVAMDDQKTIWIKKEQTEVVPDEPGFMFLGDPLKTEVPGLYIKSDLEPKQHVDGSENNLIEDPLKTEVPDLPIKPDPELKQNVNISENNFPEDPLKTEVPGLPIKPDREQKQHVDSSENNVVASTRCAFNSRRLVENSDETIMEGLDPSGLEIHEMESTHVTMFENHVSQEEEKHVFGTRLKCSWRENKHFTCNFCLHSFASKYRIIIHVFSHMIGVQPPTYICKSCGEIFSSEIGLNKHVKMNENDHTSSADKLEPIYKHQTMLLESNAKQSSSQPNHLTGTKSHKCVVHKSFNHTPINTPMTGHKSNVCDKSFNKLSNVKMQALIHLGMKPHKCDFCGKTFTRLSHLKTHALIHTGMKPHKCEVCGKSFNHLSTLKQHALIHTGMKPHKCEVCGKTFTQLSSLKVHALIHTGMKPHKCEVCGKSFNQLSDLKKHALIHTGMKLHKCEVCRKSFSQLGCLKKHAMRHTGMKTQM